MNNLELLIKNWKHLLVLGILTVGLIVGVYLVQTQKIFQSKATDNIDSILKVTDDQDQELKPIGKNTYQTTSDTINVSIKDLQELSK